MKQVHGGLLSSYNLEWRKNTFFTSILFCKNAIRFQIFNQKDMIRLNGRKLKKCFAQPLLAKILGILEMISIRISTRYSIELRNTLTSEVEVAKVHRMWFCF